MDDEDGAEDGGGSRPNSCDCNDEKHVSCFGCGACYATMLDRHNSKAKTRKEKLWTDFDNDTDLIDSEFGSIKWFCPDCEVILLKGFVQSFTSKLSSDITSGENTAESIATAKDSLLVKLSAETTDIKDTLDKVAAHLNLSAYPPSPPRKYVKFSWQGNNLEPDSSFIPPTPQQFVDTKKTYCEKVKLNIKTEGNALKKLHENRHLMHGMTTRKKKSDGSVDLLFDCFNEANKARKTLKDKLDSVVVSDPSLDRVNRCNLVGLTFDLTKAEALQCIIDENRSWIHFEKTSENTLMIKDDPFSVLTVHDVVKCRNNDIFRISVTMSNNLLASLGDRKLSVGFSKCKLYKVSNHNRCYNCQRTGHFAKDCQNEIACSRCSLGHDSRECKSTTAKCVNCVLNSENNVNHPSYSTLCPHNLCH